MTRNLIPFLSKHRLLIVFGAVYFLLSLYVMIHFVVNSRSFGDEFHRLRYEDMLKGTAWNPFSYRVLIPKLTIAVRDMTPAIVQMEVAEDIRSGLKDNAFIARYMPQLIKAYEGATFEKCITTLWNYLFLFGYAWLMFLLAKELFSDDYAIRWFAPIFGMLVVPSFSWQWVYIYDIPILCLSAACYYVLLTKQYGLFIPLFALATLNRETSIFIGIFFVIHYFRRMPAAHYWLMVALLALVYSVIRITLYYASVDNAGWFMEDNLVRMLSHDVFSKSNYARLLMIATGFFLLTYQWMEKPAFLKCGLWILPIFYVAYIKAGYPGEYRVFYDIMPLLVLLGTHTLIAGTGISQSPVFAKKETA